MQDFQPLQQERAKPFFKAENVFKMVACLVVIMWSVCLKNFFAFREYLEK